MYTFPFHTCELVQPGIAQPYSALLNLINSLMIFSFLIRTTHFSSFLVLFSILCFEVFHMFSHAVHIPGSIQTTVIHLLAYFVNASLFFFFYQFSKHGPSLGFLLFCSILLVGDVYAFFHMNLIYYFMSQIVLFLSILFYYYPLLTPSMKQNIRMIFLLSIVILLLFFNEKYNCHAMLSAYSFPYHSFIEIVGIGLFYTVCRTFYKN